MKKIDLLIYFISYKKLDIFLKQEKCKFITIMKYQEFGK